MSAYTFAIRPLLFSFDAEKVHDFTIKALKVAGSSSIKPIDNRLSINVAGIDFPSPLGLAAGFDKDIEAPQEMLAYGFGSVEVGTVTPEPQVGNPLPRIFRLVKDEAVINRMGFPSSGHAVALDRLTGISQDAGVIGVNIGANKTSEDKIADYVKGIESFGDIARYITINVSSPNTPGLRDLQQKSVLTELLARVNVARENHSTPLFLKVSPDLSLEEVESICEVLAAQKIDGLIVGNTTVQRPKNLKSRRSIESGGLSGKPLKEISQQTLLQFRKCLGSSIPLIGVGGIWNGDDAYERILCGASLVQLYTAFAYEGPNLANEINDRLIKLMDRDGFKSISQVVGAKA